MFVVGLSLTVCIYAADDTATQNGTTGNWTNGALWGHTNGAAAGQFPNNGNAGLMYDAVFGNNGATVTLTQDITIEAFTQNGNTLDGANNLTLNGLYTFNNGTVAGSGTLFAGGGISMPGSVNVIFKRNVTSSGTVTKSGTGNFEIDLSKIFTNDGTFNATNGFSFTGDGTGGFTNAGSFVSNPGAAKIVDFFSAPLNNTSTGALSVVSGTLRVRSGTSLGGSVDVASGAHLEFRAGAFDFSMTNPTFTGAGSLDFTGAGISFKTATGGTPISIPNAVTFQTGMWTSGDAVTTGVVNWTGTTISGAGTWTVGNGGTANVTAPVQLQTRNLTVASGGTAVVTAAISTSGGADVVNDGDMTLGAGAGFVNLDGSPSTFTNTGTTTITGPDVGILPNPSGPNPTEGYDVVNKGGNLTVQQGAALKIEGGSFTQEGGTTSVDGTLESEDPFFVKYGRVEGRGALLCDMIFLAASGFAGGVAPGHSAGQLTITGNLTLADDTHFEVELAGTIQATEYDLLAVSETAMLDGFLDIELIDGFEQQVTGSDVFTVLTAGTISGAFGNVPSGSRVTTADGKGSFQVFYGSGSPFDADNVVLTNFIAVPEPSTLALAAIGALIASSRIRRRN